MGDCVGSGIRPRCRGRAPAGVVAVIAAGVALALGGCGGGTATASGCTLTIVDPFAQIDATPGSPQASGEHVPHGTYRVITSKALSFGGSSNRWYEISVDGKQGWIEDDGVQIASKSSACPIG